MRIYTKEWHQLSDLIGTTDMFDPIIDKDYSDEEIEALYQDMLEKDIQEERALYDEPPVYDEEEWADIFSEDEFDPEDFLIADINEDGEEFNHRHPQSCDELKAYRRAEYEYEWKQYENREPFDEDEVAEYFEENYKELLEEPDEDIPEWVREAVDPRLLALYLLPESVYKKLRDEEEALQARFDELDEIADQAEDERLDNMPEELEGIEEKLDESEYDCVLNAGKNGDDYIIKMIRWDDEGEAQEKYAIVFENALMLEDEQPVVTVDTDEDGDTESDCEYIDHELYYEDGLLEVHLLLDNGANGLKYVTLRCDAVRFE